MPSPRHAGRAHFALAMTTSSSTSYSPSALRAHDDARETIAERVSPWDLRPPPSAFRVPPSALRLPPPALRLPPSALRPPPSAFRLPPSALAFRPPRPPRAYRLHS